MFTKIIAGFLIVFSALVGANETNRGFVSNDGVRIHYLEKKNPHGEKPDLLFVPGLSMPAWIWNKQLEYFSKNYTVVAMDPRSQGDSTQTPNGQYPAARASDIKAVVDKLQLKPVVLIGWSLAVGEVVAYLSEFGSDGVAGIVLVDGFAGLYPNSPSINPMLEYWTDFQTDRVAKTPGWIKGMFVKPQSEEYLDKLTKASLRTPTNTLMALVYNFIFIDYRPTLSSIKVPTLVIGINMPWLADIKELQQKIPNSRLVVIEEAGHAVFVDQPEKFNRELEKFLEQDL